jgi:hypothetical protein
MTLLPHIPAFLGSTAHYVDLDRARCSSAVRMKAVFSYEAGTAAAPAAVLEASYPG